MPGVRAAARGVMARRASGVFAPTDITGCQLWLEASDCSAVGDGNAVTDWVDRVSGHTFTQGTAANRPLYRATSNIGSKPALDFDGTNDRLTLGSAAFSNTAGTVFTVVRHDTDVAQTYYSTNDNATATRFCRQAGRVGGTGGQNDTLQIRQRSADTADNVVGNNDAIVINTNYVCCTGSTGTAYFMEINGTAQTLQVVGGADNGDWYGDTANRDNFCVGALESSSPSEFMNGLIAEIIDYNVALTSTQIDQVTAYLGAKYGITV